MCIYTLDQVFSKGIGKIFDMSSMQNSKFLFEMLFDLVNEKQITLAESDEYLFVKMLSSLLIVKREYSLEIVGSFIKLVAIMAQKTDSLKLRKTLLFFLSKIQ